MSGGIVYIKEAWAAERRFDHLKPRDIPHTAKIFYLLDGYDQSTMGKKRSPLFMPAWAARYFYKVTAVRAELFQESAMSADDLLAEGGNKALETLQDYDGKWVFVYCLRMVSPIYVLMV